MEIRLILSSYAIVCVIVTYGSIENKLALSSYQIVYVIVTCYFMGNILTLSSSQKILWKKDRSDVILLNCLHQKICHPLRPC
jgi:hypothetical protein